MRVREHEKEATDLMQKTMVDKKTITTLREVSIDGSLLRLVSMSIGISYFWSLCQWESLTSGLYVNGDLLLLIFMSMGISSFWSLCQ